MSTIHFDLVQLDFGFCLTNSTKDESNLIWAMDFVLIMLCSTQFLVLISWTKSQSKHPNFLCRQTKVVWFKLSNKVQSNKVQSNIPPVAIIETWNIVRSKLFFWLISKDFIECIHVLCFLQHFAWMFGIKGMANPIFCKC